MCNIFVIWEVCIQKKSHKMNEKGTLILPLLINHVNQLEIYSEEKIEGQKIKLMFLSQWKVKTSYVPAVKSLTSLWKVREGR